MDVETQRIIQKNMLLEKNFNAYNNKNKNFDTIGDPYIKILFKKSKKAW